MATTATNEVVKPIGTKSAGQQAAAAEQPNKVIAPLKSNDLKLREFSNNDWVAVAPSGSEPQDLEKDPKFWANCGQMVKLYDRIAVVSRDQHWWAEYLVVDHGPGYARVTRLLGTSLPPRQADTGKELPTGFAIQRTGPDELPGYKIIRVKDQFAITNSGVPFDSFEAARRYLLDMDMFRNEQSTQYFPR
jgi:hypothetical protein